MYDKVVRENYRITRYLPYFSLIEMKVRSPLPMYLYWLGYFQWQMRVRPLLGWGYEEVVGVVVIGFYALFQVNGLLELVWPNRFTLIKQCCFYFLFAELDDGLSYIVNTKLLFVFVFLSYSIVSFSIVNGLTKCNALTWYSSPNTPISELPNFFMKSYHFTFITPSSFSFCSFISFMLSSTVYLLVLIFSRNFFSITILVVSLDFGYGTSQLPMISQSYCFWAEKVKPLMFECLWRFLSLLKEVDFMLKRVEPVIICNNYFTMLFYLKGNCYTILCSPKLM